jgi:hypothetical protein
LLVIPTSETCCNFLLFMQNWTKNTVTNTKICLRICLRACNDVESSPHKNIDKVRICWLEYCHVELTWQITGWKLKFVQLYRIKNQNSHKL